MERSRKPLESPNTFGGRVWFLFFNTGTFSSFPSINGDMVRIVKVIGKGHRTNTRNRKQRDATFDNLEIVVK